MGKKAHRGEAVAWREDEAVVELVARDGRGAEM
jgi:hypothetical protein